MRFSLKIALRYLFSKKSTNAINIIAGISTLGIFVSAAALIIILSVFNGFESIVIQAYHPFTPDLKVSPVKGKSLAIDSTVLLQLRTLPGVENVVPVLEDKALLSYEDKQCIVTLKGVGETFAGQASLLDSAMIAGEPIVQEDTNNYALMGQGVVRALNVNVLQTFKPLTVYAPHTGSGSGLGMEGDFTRAEIYPSGSFSVQQEYDYQYVVVPLRFAAKVFRKKGYYSSLEVQADSSVSTNALRREVAGIMGDRFKVEDKYQQNEVLYKILNSERWSVYLILSFVALIAICNIIGSLTMLVIDKKKDIATLQALGSSMYRIRQIYLLEGIMIAFLGCMLGLIAGGLFAWLQQRYGFIAAVTDSTGARVNAYPVLLKVKDFVLVFSTVMGIAALASWLTVNYGLKQLGPLRESLTEPT